MQKELIKIKSNQGVTGAMIAHADQEFVISIIKELVMVHFEKLGNDLGDCLSLAERWNSVIHHRIEEHFEYESQEISRANEINIDKLANGLDNILKVHILTILSDCQNLISK